MHSPEGFQCIQSSVLVNHDSMAVQKDAERDRQRLTHKKLELSYLTGTGRIKGRDTSSKITDIMQIVTTNWHLDCPTSARLLVL